MNDIIHIHNLSKKYSDGSGKQNEVIDSLNLTLQKGEILALVGESGCGKSTLLNLIAGLIPSSSGTLHILDQAPIAGNRALSYLQQKPQLLPYRNVLENAALGLELQETLSEKTLRRLTEILETMGLQNARSFYPAQLSGGMAQRVACARAFALEAPVMLCDEPFAALDYNTLIEIETLFWKQARERGTSCLFVTHQLDSALGIADRILVLAARPMKVHHEIILIDDFKNLDPLRRREASVFPSYFSQLWNALSSAKKKMEISASIESHAKFFA